MDFFQAQDNAIRKTKQLVFYFALAVVCIVLAVYMAVTFGYLLYEYLLLPEMERTVTSLETPVWELQRFVVVSVCVVLLVGLGSLFKTLSLRGGGAAVATTLGGELVDRSTRDPKRRQLLNVVEEMAIASGVPVPGVYILKHETSINAFAAGWSKDDAVIAVSAGALEQLSRDELQGVVAHEYSHVLYGDCRLNIRLMGILYGIMMLTIFGKMMRLLIYSGSGRHGRGVVIVSSGRRRGGGNSKGGGGAIILVVIVVIILITIIGYIGTFFGRLIQAAISRQREFLADAAAVQFTRNPDGIAGALKKIVVHTDQSVLSHPNAGEAAHMFFADGIERSLSSALATHPPLKERIMKVQPNWDGKYDSVKEHPSRTVERAKVHAAASRPGGKDFIEGMSVIGAVGTLSSANLATARQITNSIPESLDEQMRNPEGARHSILALIMADNADDDAEQLELIDATYPGEAASRIREVLAQIQALPRDARLGVLEMATSTLAQSPSGTDQEYFDLVDKLIHVDDTFSLYEFCIRRILRERLFRTERVPQANASVQYMNLSPAVARAASQLLSVIARTSSTMDAADLFDKAVKGQYLLNGKVSYCESNGRETDPLDEALDVLRQTAYAIRAQVLRAVVACIQDDGKLSPEEAEILRALCLSLDCPVPPVALQK